MIWLVGESQGGVSAVCSVKVNSNLSVSCTPFPWLGQSVRVEWAHTSSVERAELCTQYCTYILLYTSKCMCDSALLSCYCTRDSALGESAVVLHSVVYTLTSQANTA